MSCPTPSVPALDCDLCPRLVEFRLENKAKFPDFFNAPVPSFGPIEAEVLVVGLAPGLKGANCTGRPFTGDYAGDLLYPTLKTFGFATGTYGGTAEDGFELQNCRITNAVRCVPPQNKTTGAEEKACRPFLIDEMKAMTNLKAIVALGGVGHNAVIQTLGLKKSQWKFGHNMRHEMADDLPILFDSYHCSRYNTNTGRLTEEMFHDVFRSVCEELK
ncbi:Uracil-DNA glycosylase superfamily protein [Candidatus Terasakiella magnetica]|uniref:Type-5 uracil-DNA glycosylase n=1 Tax=Candidatus Terasakiella magnetica TaxID=1867952 RepID=A0A1C3RCS9_9PROT|nr:uracil-DNA glycosylase [Candidatus Terasakiella magnetica]SCA55086.1 Uracil-DNA glycosylase superfamily protein [Candidatus Terasakiella magnetica]